MEYKGYVGKVEYDDDDRIYNLYIVYNYKHPVGCFFIW